MMHKHEAWQRELDDLEDNITELRKARDDIFEQVKRKQLRYKEFDLIREQLKWFEAENMPRIVELKKLLRNAK